MKKCITTILFLIVLLSYFCVIATAQPPDAMRSDMQNPPRPDGFRQGGPPLPNGENRPPLPAPGIYPEPMGPPPEGDLPAREILEQVLLAKVAKQLKLNDEQTVILVRRFNEQKEVLFEKTQQRNNLANELRKQIHDKTKANPKELEEKFSRLLKMDMELAELKQKWIDNISIDLPLESKVQLYLLFSDFENEIRKFLRKAYDWKQNRFLEEKGGLMPPEQQRRGRVPKNNNNPEVENE
ncbi:MAG TPA: hypothetical protein PLA12_01515 [Candidatus Hydrogenedens sp.]|mgnify:CR=1 FL=1|nr:hypothetical protein [Candidatus Hydrogenedens sp.]